MEERFVRDEELNFEAVVFASDTGERFHVQRALAFDDQDRASGMDTYCSVTANGATTYGGVRHLDLRERGVRLTFEVEAAESLGVPEVVDVDLDATSHHEVRRHLPRLLGR